MKSLLAVGLLAVACSSESVIAITPTALFTGAVNTTLTVGVAAGGYPGGTFPTDGGSIVVDPTLGISISAPSSGGSFPLGFTFWAFVTPPGTTLQPGTFTDQNAMYATTFFSDFTTPDAGSSWSQFFQSQRPPEIGSFSLTITSAGPVSNPDGGTLGPGDPREWATPHGYYSATMTPTTEPDAGSVMVNVTF